VLPRLPALGFAPQGQGFRCPDGLSITPDPAQPLLSLGGLLQEDFCLMQRDGDGVHRLTGAILCFPAGRTLAEKFGQPMARIHQPVALYTEDLARRVDRLFDGVQPGRVLMRGTAHAGDAPLHNPRREAEGREIGPERLPSIRVKRQGLVRLPETQAVAFSIHTYLVRPEALSPEQAAQLAAFPIRSAV
jgi:dimethylamine monooxygenase subunit A